MAEVLVLSDNLRLAEQVLGALPNGLQGRVGTPRDLVGSGADLVVVDAEVSQGEGLALARDAVFRHPEQPVVLIAPLGRMDLAIEALRAGVTDVVTVPVEPRLLALSVQRAMRQRAMRRELHRLKGEVGPRPGLGPLVGESAPMQQLYRMIERVARAPSGLLIVGESGAGKEMVARAIHDLGPRAAAPFVAINCAAVPETLLESELFGHVRGAFTDARTNRSGLFAQAEHGTLLLDEIGDLPAALQPKLLRVLQERVYKPVGADKEVPFDVRVVAATHRDLDVLVTEGKFRRDLLFRLDVVRVEVPPLRERGVDILALANRFLAQFAAQMERRPPRLSAEVARILLDHDWPGNVRELQNCMERAVMLADGDEVMVGDLPPRLRSVRPRVSDHAEDDPSNLPTLEEVERRHVLRVLAATEGNRAHAARILGLDRKTLWRKLRAWGVAEGDAADGP
jgi:two-component system response regulator HydG